MSRRAFPPPSPQQTSPRTNNLQTPPTINPQTSPPTNNLQTPPTINPQTSPPTNNPRPREAPHTRQQKEPISASLALHVKVRMILQLRAPCVSAAFNPKVHAVLQCFGAYSAACIHSFVTRDCCTLAIKGKGIKPAAPPRPPTREFSVELPRSAGRTAPSPRALKKARTQQHSEKAGVPKLTVAGR